MLASDVPYSPAVELAARGFTALHGGHGVDIHIDLWTTAELSVVSSSHDVAPPNAGQSRFSDDLTEFANGLFTSLLKVSN